MTVTLKLSEAQLCASCDTVSDATGEECPACKAKGTLLSLARVLNRDAETERKKENDASS